MATTIAIINYGMGNRRSVEKAFLEVDAEAFVTDDPDRVLSADGAVVVGVGAFPTAMQKLAEYNMLGVLQERFALGRPILGICLGLQLFFEGSDEHKSDAEGLKFLKGRVQKIPANGLKVPHIGWNQVEWSSDSRLCAGIEEADSTFYHLHSFASMDPDRSEVVGTTTYGRRFVTAIEEPPLYGVQFHPEKSSKQGLQLLKNFVDICSQPVHATA